MRGRGRKERGTNDEEGIRAVELQLDLNTIQVCLIENIKDTWIATKCLNTHQIDQGGVR